MTAPAPGLLACPFCGGPAILEDNDPPPDDRMFWCIACSKCNCIIDAHFWSDDEAIAAWNRRPTSPASADVADIRARCEAGDLVRAMLGLGYVGDENAVSLGLLIENAFRATLQSALAENAKHEQQAKRYIELLVAQSDIEIDLRIKIDTLTDQIGRLETQGLMQAHQNITLTAECERLRKALERLRQPHSCGCKPCTGQCLSNEAIRAQIDEMRDYAAHALQPAAATGGEGT